MLDAAFVYTNLFTPISIQKCGVSAWIRIQNNVVIVRVLYSIYGVIVPPPSQVYENCDFA